MERTTKSGLIIPVDVAGVRTVKFTCQVCGDEFFDNEMSAFQRHVAACCKRHEDAIHAVSPRRYLEAFESGEGWDTDYERWVKANPEKWKRERDIPT